MAYLNFLRSKVVTAPVSGFQVDPTKLSPALKPHQRDAVGYLEGYEETNQNISLFDFVEVEQNAG